MFSLAHDKQLRMDYLSMSTTKTRRKMSARGLLITMVVVMLLAWGGLLVFTRYVPPQSVPAIAAVFVLLSVALFCTFVPLTYLITRAIFAARSRRPRLSQAVREGGLISAWLIFNLLLRVLQSWSLFTTLVSFGIIVVVEILVLGRM